ncbi:MAG: precorrin-8X methylmutase, partial [Chloroflexota bacterium]|nr:precorrin-8X methylmutase [Chloroflexota bacterium]
MKGVLLLGHGSNRAEANQMVIGMTSKLRADLGTELIEPAFLQLAGPDIGTGLGRLMERGCREIFVLCLFLVSGNHHSRDAGTALERSLEAYPGVKFTLSEPLLVYPGFYDLIASRVGGELHNGRHRRDSGLEIERESFEIVDRHLAGLAVSGGERQVVRRVVHATADPELGRAMVFHPQAVTAA